MKQHEATAGNGHPAGASLRAGARREFKPPEIGPDDAAAVAVQLAISAGYHRLLAHEESARLGDVEGVHRLRTSTRRLRSDLRTYEPLLDGGWAHALGEELKWLGEHLGAVRDLDVLQNRLRESWGGDAKELGPLFDSLERRHNESSQALRQALSGERYLRLLKQLAAAADRPLMTDGAWEPCRSALPPLAEQAWKRLRRSARRLDEDSPDADFHETRKRAKRARYAAESVSLALPSHLASDATRFARRATQVQDVLGEHQDATVACAEIHRAVEARPTDGRFCFAAGRLLEREGQAASEARDRFFKVWDRLDRGKIVRWLKS